MFVRVYIENGLRRWYDQNNRLKFILRNEFKIFNYEIKRKIISEVRIMDRIALVIGNSCLLYTSPSPRDRQKSRMPSSA